MKVDKINSKKLIKWVYFVPLFSMTVIVVFIAMLFIHKEKQVYENDIDAYKIKLLKLKKLEMEDRITKLSEQIQYNKKILLDQSKDNVKNMVDFAYKIIRKTYNENKIFGKDYVIEIIKDSLRNMRFFDDLSGYFYMYKMDGTCLLLPTNPEYEGKNLIGVKDATGTKIIQKAINELKQKDKVYNSWYWYKPGEKIMKKKIGYYRWFKPLDIYIGSAFYEEDIIKKTKKIALKIIRNYRFGDKGYIFAYDYKGNTLSHIQKKFIGKNRLNLFIDNRHILKEMIKGARLNKEGFFMSYMASIDPFVHKPSRKISYIKSIPEFKWIIGAGFYVNDIRKAALSQYKILQQELDRIVRTIIIVSLIMILVLGLVMITISNRIKHIIDNYEKDLLDQYNEIINQKRVFQLLFEKSKDGIFLDSKDKFIDCNESALIMFGAKNKKELLSKKAKELLPKYQPDGQSSLKKIKNIFKTVQEKGVYKGELVAKKINGENFWIDMVITYIVLNNKSMYYTVFRDIDKRKKMEKKLKASKAKLAYRARHDKLTDLPNRFSFDEISTHEILKAKREQKKLALFFIDLDGFKMVNDLYGHNIGDILLQQASDRIKFIIRGSDYLFRFGGDEFVILVSGFGVEKDLANICHKIIESINKPFHILNHAINVGVSIGLAMYPNDAKDTKDLLRNADIAMYRAKNSGKNGFVFFENEMYQKIVKEEEIENEIKQALKNDEFILYFQPQIDALANKIVGLEALVRWKKDGKIISPGQFLPVATKSNLIKDIGSVVMQKAIWFATKFQNLNIGRISINLDDKQLKDKNLIFQIKDTLLKYGCDSKLIEFEVTEGFIMEDVDNAVNLLAEIKDMGCSVSIDDFGTGYSSLSYIKNLPFDVLKIDQSFIKDIPGTKEDEAIIKTLIELAKGLGIKLIAEGIENETQKNFIVQEGCKIIQGYYYSKPLPEDEIVEFIKRYNNIG